jgi:hypothetical protein
MKYIVICRDCGFRSGLRDTPEEATEAWNTRHYPLPSEEEMENMAEQIEVATIARKAFVDGAKWLIEFIKTK